MGGPGLAASPADALSPFEGNEGHEARRVARFWSHGHSPGAMDVKTETLNPQFPYTLDLRRRPS